MATYEYECPSDGEMLLVTRSMTEPEADYSCETCGGKLQRVWTAPPVKFNGTGFYSTGG